MSGGHHHHDHSHDHHGHHHGHAHPEPGSDTRAFAIGTALNVVFVIVEAAAGFWTGSMALLADAGHNLGDVAGLLLSWGAVILARRRPSLRRTYGFRRGTILAALGNGLLISAAAGMLLVESVERVLRPPEVPAVIVLAVAACGVLVNGLSAMLFMSDRKHDLNMRAAYLHLAADAAISLGVVIAGAVIHYTGWYFLDPLTGIAVCLLIFAGTWGLVRESADLVLDAVPEGVDPEAVRTYLMEQEGVSDVHELHIWALSTTENALTAHLVIPDARSSGDGFIARLSADLRERFSIHHPTLQIETAACDGGRCDNAAASP